MTDAYGWIINKRCRICGGPITAIQSPIKVRSDERLGDDDDLVDETVELTKYRSRITSRFEHVVSGYCGRCGIGFSYAQMEDGEPDPPMLARVGA